MMAASELRALAPGDVERLAVLARISRAINGSYDVDETLAAAMGLIVDTLHVGRGCIMLACASGTAPHIVVARGIDTQSWQLQAFEYSRTVVARAWQSGESLLSNDVQHDQGLSKIASLRKLRTRSLMCVPMRVRGQTTGMIYVDNDQRANLFSPTELRLLEIIADLAAVAVERARYYVELTLQVARPPASLARLEALGRQARGIAHDFDNIVAIVRANSSAALFELAKGEIHQAGDSLRSIQTSCAHAQALCRLLVTYAEPAQRPPEGVEVNSLLISMEPFLHSVIGADCTLHMTLAAEPCVVPLLPVEVSQIVLNLAGNARKAMPKGGVLEIETALERAPGDDSEPRSASHVVRITVTDTGTGLAETALCGATQGTLRGVGLSLIQELLAPLGGSLRVFSTPNSGSRFDVHLPCRVARR